MVQPADITETVNYVRAMNAGLRILKELLLSGRLIRAVHEELLTGVRGVGQPLVTVKYAWARESITGET